MKLLTLLVMILSFNLYASVAFEAEGVIEENEQVIVLPEGTKINIDSMPATISECKKGRFLVVSSMVEPGKVDIIEILRCDESLVCPKIFEPVCGESAGKLRQFGNSCELYEQNAVFVDYGKCKATL